MHDGQTLFRVKIRLSKLLILTKGNILKMKSMQDLKEASNLLKYFNNN